MRIIGIDVGTGDNSNCEYVVLAFSDGAHYVRSGQFAPKFELLEALLLSEQYDVVAIERGFLAPGNQYGKSILKNIENSAVLHHVAQRIQHRIAKTYTLLWPSYPQWSRELCGTRRAATTREIRWYISREIQHLPKSLSVHAIDAAGIALWSYYASKRCSPTHKGEAS